LPRYIGNSYEQSAGRRSSPDSKRGILTAWQRERFRTYCPNHPDGLHEVVDVTGIKQQPSKAVYNVTLDCNCQRVVTIGLRRPVPKYVVPVLSHGESEEVA
jgi:hypothetical protein